VRTKKFWVVCSLPASFSVTFPVLPSMMPKTSPRHRGGGTAHASGHLTYNYILFPGRIIFSDFFRRPFQNGFVSNGRHGLRCLLLLSILLNDNGHMKDWGVHGGATKVPDEVVGSCRLVHNQKNKVFSNLFRDKKAL
jgi:hypothetical protein